MKRLISVFLSAVSAVIAADTVVSSAVPVSESPTASTVHEKVEHDGQVFELANRTAGKNVETDEYVIAGENLGNWTQLVTVQRVTLGRAMSAQEFVSFFQKKLQDENGASLEILTQVTSATVFAVRFPKSERNDEQVMICLAFADGRNPALLNVIQYAIKPTRLAVDLVETRLKSWRDKFLTQANALDAASKS